MMLWTKGTDPGMAGIFHLNSNVGPFSFTLWKSEMRVEAKLDPWLALVSIGGPTVKMFGGQAFISEESAKAAIERWVKDTASTMVKELSPERTNVP
jgi:hypothetical protein